MFPDPTNAVRSEIPGIIKPGKTISTTNFFSELAKRLPVVDGGDYFKRVLSKLDERKKRPGKGQISPALSNTLRILEAQGVIGMEYRDDSTDSVELLGRGWEPCDRGESRVSHIEFKGMVS